MDYTLEVPKQELAIGQRCRVVGEYEQDWRGEVQVVVGVELKTNYKEPSGLSLTYITSDPFSTPSMGGLTTDWKPEHLEAIPND